MIRLLIRAAVFLVSAAVGLLVAAALVDNMTVTANGFLAVVVIYAIASLLLPWILLKAGVQKARARSAD